jgi:hypothetical protein
VGNCFMRVARPARPLTPLPPLSSAAREAARPWHACPSPGARC